jgi:hypothetical protein
MEKPFDSNMIAEPKIIINGSAITRPIRDKIISKIRFSNSYNLF